MKLSELLFTGAIEPLAMAVTSLSSIIIGGIDHRIFLYADDICTVSQSPGGHVLCFVKSCQGCNKILCQHLGSDLTPDPEPG